MSALTLHAQQWTRFVIANALDSGIIAGARVALLPGGSSFVADTEGRLLLPLPKREGELKLAISGIGVRDTVKIRPTVSGLNWLLVRVGEQRLNDFVLHSLSAEDVVRKAVSMIPDNYAKSPYFCYSSYRQYQRLDSTYTNLVEARSVVMMNITERKGRLERVEAYANLKARRSYFAREPWNAYDFNATDIMSQDPIYHLDENSLAPNRFYHYKFKFDTTLGSDTNFVVHYFSPDYTSEKHGVGNSGNPFPGESWEKGNIVIDRNTFAIRKFTRMAWRHDAYHYPRYNNFVLPDKLYYVEFDRAMFLAEYVQMGERWYPSRLLYNFIDDCYGSGRAITPNVHFSCFYEWQADSFSRYTGEEYASRFYKEMYMWPEQYDPSEWQINRHPYSLTDSALLFNDLRKRGELEVQFRTNVKPALIGAKEVREQIPQSDK